MTKAIVYIFTNTCFVIECGQPDTIALSLVPKWNSFVFFEVSPISFHQVSLAILFEFSTFLYFFTVARLLKC